MKIFVDDKLNPQVFEKNVRQATQELTSLLLLATNTQSAKIESTHFLVALAKVPGGATQRILPQMELNIDNWTNGLMSCAIASPNSLPPAHLTESNFHDSARNMLEAAATLCEQYKFSVISEAVLLYCGLLHSTPKVRAQFQTINVDLKQQAEKIKRDYIDPPTVIEVFKNDHVALDVFQPGAKKTLTLMQREAESLGFKIIDPRHLLLALLERENGVTQYGIFHQTLVPRRIQEAVMYSLRSRSKQGRSTLQLNRDHLQPILQHILKTAGEFAGRDHLQRIAEAHLLRALLAVESAARNLLADERVNIGSLLAIAEAADLSQEEEADDDAMADIKTVKARLLKRLVGQNDAIERILPYVQRMRFGFTTPGRPVGVFLFCGQSGSGKTEMAKELARAVYGSEESLTFLEMGQFNAPESMNIFVGAAPGYVGYGEGKLTNGLRDKPRSVVLFDEVEKAHAKVLDALLRFLDEGKIDDPAGPVRDGTQCIVILTSNLGADVLSQLWKQIENNINWRYIVREKLREEFRRNQFRPEFLNRVDELILFRTLTTPDYAEIASRLLERDLERLRKEREIDIVTDPSVARFIGEYCAAINEGARAAQRLTQSVVITPVIDFLLRQSITPPVRLKVHAVRAGTDPGIDPVGVVEYA